MFTIIASVALAYPPEAVFAALASIEGTVRWQSGVRAVRRARAPLPAGASGEPPAGAPGPAAAAAPPNGDAPAGVPPLILHYWALGVRHALRTRVTLREPWERFAYRAEGAGLAYDASFTVDPTPHGCHVTCTVVLGDTPPGPAAVDAVRLRRLLARRLPGDLARLEAWVAVQPGARRRPAAAPLPT